MPRPLDAADAARIRAIFALQDTGQVDAAVRTTRMLRNTSLLGDILADRYLAPTARPGLPALRDWLRRWADLPDAPAIRRLLSDLAHGRTSLPPATAVRLLPAEAPDAPPPEEADPAAQAFARNALLDRTVRNRLDQGRSHDSAGARSALRLVAATRFADPLYAAMLHAEIAQRLFAAGDDDAALRTARLALRQSGGRVGLAAFIGGLASWRQDRIALAQGLFEQASRGDLSAASIRAAAAYWAARAHARLQDEPGSRIWLQRAAASSDTFYGMLARRMLERGASPVQPASDRIALGSDDDRMPAGVLGEVDVSAVAETEAGRRAFALLQVGQSARAEAALRQLWPRVQDDPALCRSIALVAQAAGMTGLGAQLATLLQNRDGQQRDVARFPVPRLRPRQGFTVNPALVYALIRVESNFDPKAVSGAGAHGLMQIMPVTAAFVLGEPHRSRLGARALGDPGLNLEVGQRYLGYLAGQDGIDGDLIRLLASYNAGPNALALWNIPGANTRSDADDGDPLLFIEALPVRETRDFVHRALSYLWIYDARMDLPAPSLDALAQGHWPRFEDERSLPDRQRKSDPS